MRMQEIDIHDYARQLFDARGDKAVVEAAQKACSLEEQGQREEAETWRTSRRRSSRCADRTKAEGAPRRRQRLLAEAYLGGR